jgi:hypothetical protein
VLFWWAVIFGYSNMETWHLVNFLSLFFYAILLYLQAALILPSNLEPGMDLEAHFFSIRKWFFFIGVLLPIAELNDSLTHGLDNLFGLGFYYLFMQISGIILALIAMLTKNRIFHGVLCLVYLGTMVSWVFIQYRSIG